MTSDLSTRRTVASDEPDRQESRDFTTLRGVRTHNLESLDLDLPHNQFIVVSGVSGSGKSSLAFDTLYAEGQRRYTESLSTYARQFLRRMERPPVDKLQNVQPAIALKQKNEVNNARSTVGTVTEIDDHLQLIYSHIGRTVCPECDRVVQRDTPAKTVERLQQLEEGTRLVVVAEIEAESDQQRGAMLDQLMQEGYRRLFIDRETVDFGEHDLDELLDSPVLPVLIDRLVIRDEDDMRLAEAIEQGFNVGNGQIDVYKYDEPDSEPLIFDRRYRCNECGRQFFEPKPVLFSFNSSLGACDECDGFGKVMGIDFDKVIPNRRTSIQEGAIAPFQGKKYGEYQNKLERACASAGVPIDVPYRELSEEDRTFVEDGGTGWRGVRGFFDELRNQRHKTYVRIFLARYRGYDRCPECGGARLNDAARQVRVDGRPISDIWSMRIEEARAYFEQLELDTQDYRRVQPLLQEVRDRLKYLDTIGLGYLELGRQSRTLSGGEMQRIHLTTSLGRSLTDTLYVLDEPTAGMHAADTERLIEVIEQLRDLGNTVLVVEHEPEVIEAADYVIELGPKGGEQGGEILFDGPHGEFMDEETLTARSLRERRDLKPNPNTDEPDDWIRIRGAAQYNLAHIDVDFPHGRLSTVTGVSGSGKSTLCEEVLFNNWRRSNGEGGVEAGRVDEIQGLEAFDDVVLMDQSALGRSTRSNALTYTNAYDGIRRLFSKTRTAQLTGLSIGDFSFNTPGGRCEHCEGTGTITIEMHFLADVEIPCDECGGTRFQSKVLQPEYRGVNIAEIFEMTVDETVEFFSDQTVISNKLTPLQDVGLGYLRVGQTTATLSGGEAQRLKLASFIAEGRSGSDTEPTLFIFDEPTVGLHMLDVETLVGALRKLVGLGHTVIAIEHDLDFAARCDYIVDLGPGGGPRGGQVVACGSPYDIADSEESVTGVCLRELLSDRGDASASG